jgi:nucleotide-binding universal stress UspA family protein
MYQKILLAYDGSSDDREALTQAKGLASLCGATVHSTNATDFNSLLSQIKSKNIDVVLVAQDGTASPRHPLGGERGCPRVPTSMSRGRALTGGLNI